MKLHLVLFLSCACCVAQAAAANEAVPDPKVLATTEAILTYCGKLDPSLQEKFTEQMQQLTQGASEENLTEVRKSEEYRHAREAMEEALQKGDEKAAKAACTQQVGPSGRASGH